MNMQPSSEPDFAHSTERYRGELRLYCYRMLGSSHDSDDQVRRIFAWAARDQAHAPARLRIWLYGLATASCLDELGRRRELRGAVTDGIDLAELDDLVAERERWPAPWVEPCPDAWLNGRRDHISLGFVVALQALPPKQRAIAILRDVVGLSADETAVVIGLDTAASEAALVHARATLETRLPPPSAGADQVLLARYARAWHDGDVDALVALLHDDIHTTRAPSPTPLTSREANLAFYRALFGTGHKWLLRRVAANGQPAFAFYRAGEPCALQAIQLVELRDGKIARIDQFMLPAIFALFGVPREIAPD